MRCGDRTIGLVLDLKHWGAPDARSVLNRAIRADAELATRGRPLQWPVPEKFERF